MYYGKLSLAIRLDILDTNNGQILKVLIKKKNLPESYFNLK